MSEPHTKRIHWPLPGVGRVLVMEWPSDITPGEWVKVRQVIDLSGPEESIAPPAPSPAMESGS